MPLSSDLPLELLRAASDPGGGKITLIVGAGSSVEEPTAIPLAGRCSQECHDRLVADGVLNANDCPAPADLSCLADAVMRKTNRQELLVDQLSRHYALKAASPNEGHLLAAALLREGVIASIVTLNFDLALSTAIGHLGVGDTIGIIDGPRDLSNQKAFNVYYLHRNVTADPEEWVLRTVVLQSEWQGTWQSVVAAKVLATPVVVFVGLGTPTAVLIESTKLIQAAIPHSNKTYQVDPGDPSESAFFTALGLAPSAYIQAGWCDFMDALSNRVVVAQTARLAIVAATMAERNQLPQEDIEPLLARLEEIGLLSLGRMRACWLLYDKPYCPDETFARELIADLLIAAAFVARVRNVTAVPCEDGIVEFRRGDRIVASHVFVSGRGTRTRLAIEGELSARQRRLRARVRPPTGAILSGTRDVGAEAAAMPQDVVVGDPSASLLSGRSTLPMYHVDSLQANPTQCAEAVP